MTPEVIHLRSLLTPDILAAPRQRHVSASLSNFDNRRSHLWWNRANYFQRNAGRILAEIGDELQFPDRSPWRKQQPFLRDTLQGFFATPPELGYPPPGMVALIPCRVPFQRRFGDQTVPFLPRTIVPASWLIGSDVARGNTKLDLGHNLLPMSLKGALFEYRHGASPRENLKAQLFCQERRRLFEANDSDFPLLPGYRPDQLLHLVSERIFFLTQPGTEVFDEHSIPALASHYDSDNDLLRTVSIVLAKITQLTPAPFVMVLIVTLSPIDGRIGCISWGPRLFETFLSQYHEERDLMLAAFGLPGASEGHREQVSIKRLLTALDADASPDMQFPHFDEAAVKSAFCHIATQGHVPSRDSEQQNTSGRATIIHYLQSRIDEGGMYIKKADLFSSWFSYYQASRKRATVFSGWSPPRFGTESQAVQTNLQNIPDCGIQEPHTFLDGSRSGQGGQGRSLEAHGRFLATVPQGEEHEKVCDDPNVLCQRTTTPDCVPDADQRFSTLEKKIASVESKLVSLLESRGVPSELLKNDGLSSDQIIFFQQLRQISGTDQNAQRRAEEILATIIGTPLTRAVIQHLAAFLKGKGWAIRCCDQPAMPVWKEYARPRKPGQGYMQLRHKTTAGRRVMHANATRFPRIALVSATSHTERQPHAAHDETASGVGSEDRQTSAMVEPDRIVPKNPSDVFRRNLANAMKAKGLGKKAVAEAARTSRSYLESVLRGDIDPSLSRCAALAAAVNYSLDELIADRLPAR